VELTNQTNYYIMGAFRRHEWVRVLADFLWSSCVVAPLVVLYWRGTWDILEDFIYPHRPDPVNATAAEETPQDEVDGLNRFNSGLICFLSAVCFRILSDLCKFHIGEFLLEVNDIARSAAGWLFNALSALAGVAFWRGVWFVYRLDLGVATGTLIGVLLLCIVILTVLRIPKSLIASPLGIDLDRHEITFSCGTYLRKTPSDGWWFLADVVLTNVFVRQVVVLAWWSLWSLENSFFYFQTPEGEKFEVVSWDSLLVGYTAAMISVSLSQTLLGLNSTKLYVGLTFDWLTTMLAFFASVNVWRGLWSFQTNFFLPHLQKDENYLISHFLGLALLSLLRVSNTIGNDNIVKNCEAEEVTPIQYWSKDNQSKRGREDMVPIMD